MRFADLFATNHLAIDDAMIENLRQHFSEQHIVELCMQCAYCVGYGRMAATYRIIEELPKSFQDTDRKVAPWEAGHSEKLAIAQFGDYTAPTLVSRLASQLDAFIDHGDPARLLASVGLDGVVRRSGEDVRMPAAETCIRAGYLCLRRIADHYQIRHSDMTSKRRPEHIAFPRQIAMYLSRHLTESSLSTIGEAFGGRDHGTVLHACRQVKDRMEVDASVRQAVNYLEDQLKR